MSTPQIDDGGSAFPVAMNEIAGAYCGMTLRDWFAGKALTGILAAPVGGVLVDDPRQWVHEHIAQASYMQADAMIAARKETR